MLSNYYGANAFFLPGTHSMLKPALGVGVGVGAGAGAGVGVGVGVGVGAGAGAGVGVGVCEGVGVIDIKKDCVFLSLYRWTIDDGVCVRRTHTVRMYSCSCACVCVCVCVCLLSSFWYYVICVVHFVIR